MKNFLVILFIAACFMSCERETEMKTYTGRIVSYEKGNIFNRDMIVFKSDNGKLINTPADINNSGDKSLVKYCFNSHQHIRIYVCYEKNFIENYGIEGIK